MKLPQIIPHKIFDLPGLSYQVNRWRVLGKKIAFTNGVFDILHKGHISSLSEAAVEADYLIVGINADASVKRLKGDLRPINDEQSRATLMASLLMVDAVIIFEEDTPLNLIKAVLPDVLVKGGDYTLEQIVGAKEVMAAGGKVVINKIVPGFSTTGIIDKIIKL
ncbi:D-glycero-beta-D-manno-heptose 1-phosphate adenylyltransferase [Flavitalea flava]